MSLIDSRQYSKNFPFRLASTISYFRTFFINVSFQPVRSLIIPALTQVFFERFWLSMSTFNLVLSLLNSYSKSTDFFFVLLGGGIKSRVLKVIQNLCFKTFIHLLTKNKSA